MAPTTYKLRVSTEQIAEWQKFADAAGLKLAEWIRRRCDGVPKPGKETDEGGDQERLRGAGRVRVDQEGAGAARAVGVAVPAANPRRGKESEIDLMVAQRNSGHEVGCGCFQCSNTRRFLESMRESEEPSAPPKKRGRPRK